MSFSFGILQLIKNYCCKKLTTTYKFGNDIAKRTYEKLGFTLPKYTYMKLNLDDKKQNGLRVNQVKKNDYGSV